MATKNTAANTAAAKNTTPPASEVLENVTAQADTVNTAAAGTANGKSKGRPKGAVVGPMLRWGVDQKNALLDALVRKPKSIHALLEDLASRAEFAQAVVDGTLKAMPVQLQVGKLRRELEKGDKDCPPISREEVAQIIPKFGGERLSSKRLSASAILAKLGIDPATGKSQAAG